VLAQTRSDGALEFDGVDDNVYVNSNFPAATNFTWSAWVNLSSANNTKIFSTPSWEFAVINGKMSIWTSTGSDLFGLSNVPLNTWVHLAVTFNGSTVTFYIDGVVDQTFTSAATSLAAVPYLRIGSHHSGGCCFVSGKVDEVRLWNVSTSQSGIQAAMNNTLTGSELGLVSYYNFNEGTGSTLADLTSNARNGSLQNMNTANAWVAGRVASGSCSVQMTTTPTVTSTPAPTPTITAGGSTTFCTGGSVTLTASAGASYLWSNGATTQAITVTTGGSYTVQVTYSAGCFATSAATVVTVNPLPTPTITAGGPTTFCQGGSVTLTASAGSSYLWSNGATTQAITVSTAGNYNVRVTNANGCFATSANTTVTVNALPTATIAAGGATTFCQGGSVVLTANVGTSYLWSNNATTQSITATTSGNYTVTVTNANGCSTTSAVRTVTVNPLPVLTVTATPTSVSRGFNTQLNVTGSNLGTFAWTPTANLSSTTIANPIARVMSTTTYTVTVSSSAGCTASGNVTVTAIDDLNITSTNVFTPNGDGINDKFVIKNLDAYPNNKLQVMDRTGKVIYEKLNYANDWNGMVNGKLLTKDTYFFILIVNGQVLKKGTVTLVR
jgi:gliding motility-associated-like protein